MALSQAEFEARMRALVAEFMEGQPLPAAPAEGPLATALENAALAVGDRLTRELLGQQLAQATPIGQQACPTCGARCGPIKQRRRVLQSRRGPVEFEEPEHYCKPCRRAFFPSLGSAGTGS